jgi:hypothetical protein
MNLLSSTDLKGYSDRLPLLMTETFSELAYSFLFCVVYVMINQWVDIITLGGRQTW